MNQNKTNNKLFNIKSDLSDKRKSRVFYLISVILLILAITGILIYSQSFLKKVKTNRLIDAVVTDTLLFAQIPVNYLLISDLDKNKQQDAWWLALKNKYQSDYLGRLNLNINDFESLLKKGVKKIGIINTKNNDLALILEFVNQNQIAKIIASDLTKFPHLITNKNIAVITSSNNLLNEISFQLKNPNAVSPKNLALQNQIKENQLSDEHVFMYLDYFLWQQILANQKLSNLVDIKSLVNNKPAFVNIIKKNQGLELNISLSHVLESAIVFDNQDSDQKQNTIIEKINNPDLIFFTNFKPILYMQQIEKKISNEYLEKKWNGLIDIWKEKYILNSDEINIFLNQNLTLAVPVDQIDNFFSGNYDILSNPYLLVFKKNNESVFFLEMVKKIIAVRNPEEKITILTDNSEAIELIAEPQNINFLKTDDGKKNYYWLQNGPEKVGYFIMDDYLFFSSSIDMLNKIYIDLNKSNNLNEESKQTCLKTPKTLIHFNQPGTIHKNLSLFKKATLMGLEHKKNYLSINLCLEY